MSKEQAANENFVVESAMNGLYELFGEDYETKFDAYQSEESAIEKAEEKIYAMIDDYWKILVRAFGGDANSNTEGSNNAKKSANFAMLKFLNRLYSSRKAIFGGDGANKSPEPTLQKYGV